jgi:pyruvate dehydrogenase E2 component (dihydrolipoamide acetyltransferase)
MKPPDFGRWGNIEREEMSKVRSITAKNMSAAWSAIPHVTQFDKADITELERFRKKYSRIVEDAGGKLTVTAVLLKVIAAALEHFPRFNASIDVGKNEIIYKKYYHIGMAVDTDRGLLVPVIRDVNKKSIVELAVELTELAEKARRKQIRPDDLEGGTFTISNQGSIGGTDFTPIIYWPQVAILGVSKASTLPAYIDGELKPRKILPLSLSYDHRVNDGADAARFLSWVVEALEHPLLLSFET